jgi:hypothetical protein
VLGNGFVGIGSNAPTAHLFVSGPGTNAVAQIENSTAGSTIDALQVGIANCGSACAQGTARNIVLYNNNITNANFGSLTFVPAATPASAEGSSITGIDRDITNNSAGLDFSTRDVPVGSGGTGTTNLISRLTIKKTGQVGIGTSTPATIGTGTQKLTVISSGDNIALANLAASPTSAWALATNAGGIFSSTGSLDIIDRVNSRRAIVIGNDAANGPVTMIGGLTSDNGGGVLNVTSTAVGIGTGTVSPGTKLAVNGSISTTSTDPNGCGCISAGVSLIPASTSNFTMANANFTTTATLPASATEGQRMIISSRATTSFNINTTNTGLAAALTISTNQAYEFVYVGGLWLRLL